MDKNIVTVFADDNKKYLSTDLSKDIDNNEKFISNKIELIKYEWEIFGTELKCLTLQNNEKVRQKSPVPFYLKNTWHIVK